MPNLAQGRRRGCASVKEIELWDIGRKGAGADARCELPDPQRTGDENKGHVHVNQPNHQETELELL